MNMVHLDLRCFDLRPSRSLTLSLTHLSQKRDEVLRSPPRILVHGLPVVIVRSRRARVHHDCESLKQGSHQSRRSRSIRWWRIGTHVGRETRRTINASPTAKTLPTLHDRRASAKCGARTRNVRAHGAGSGREVGKEVKGDGMCRVIVRRGTCFEREDSQVGVGGSQTTSNNARCRAACYNRM